MHIPTATATVNDSSLDAAACPSHRVAKTLLAALIFAAVRNDPLEVKQVLHTVTQ